MNMIERVAWAMYARDQLYVERHLTSTPKTWHDLPEIARQGYRDDVIQVLTELREPTRAMMDAGDEWTNHHADCVYSIWQAMIDAALVEK